MTMDPRLAVGLVMTAEENEEGKRGIPLGSCAAYRHPRVLLTAAHCVRDIHQDLAIVAAFPHRPEPIVPIERVELHPTADLAVLFGFDLNRPSPQYSDEAFWNWLQPWLGEDFMAHGYPVEGSEFVNGRRIPTERLFRGNVQRVFEYNDGKRYRYAASELSIPAPGGLSGGPLWRPAAPQMMLGIVTRNFDAYSTLDSFEEVTESGERRRVEHHRIISYALAVEAFAAANWVGNLLSRTVNIV